MCELINGTRSKSDLADGHLNGRLHYLMNCLSTVREEEKTKE